MRNLIVVAALLFSSCVTDTTDAKRALRNQGFTHINITGMSFFGCGKDDLPGRTFRAKNPHGDTVEGVVCCGILKGCTVRF